MKNLKKIRKRKGMSIKELSERSGVNRQTIWLIESGQQRNARVETVKKFAEILDCSVIELLE